MPEGLVSFASGGVAGFCEICVTMPLDTIKTQMQLAAKGGKAMGAVETTKNIISLKGPAGLYYGMSAMVTQVSAKAAIRFAANEQFRLVLRPILGAENKTKVNFISGIGAGITEAAVWVTPTERVKVLLQQEIRSATPKYTSMVGATKAVLAEQGVGGLFVGFVPTAARQGLAMGVRFVIYDELKSLIAGGGKANAMQQLTAGMATGTISSMINQPIDTAKSRIQAQGKGSGVYTGTVQCLTAMAKEEGLLSWYRGSMPRIARLTIGQGIIFCSYDQISAALSKAFAK